MMLVGRRISIRKKKKKWFIIEFMTRFTLNGENSLTKLRPTLLNATIGKNFVE
jgi:hypothetical protein